MKPVVPLAMLLGFLPFAAMTCPSQADTPAPTALTAPASPISKEPFFADIVRHADVLKTETERFAAAKPSLGLLNEPVFKAYLRDIKNLSGHVMQGHVKLKKRGTDNDLKCIMMGLTLDLDIKNKALSTSKSDAELNENLIKTASLLSDVHEVIVTPATTDSGLDCTLEFGNK